jgi:hypothetical protein
MRKMVEEKGFKLQLQNEAIKMEVDSLDAVLPLLVNRKWMVLRAPPASPGFLTSDNPVCLMFDDPKFRGCGSHRLGFGLRATSVTVPLGQRLAIVGKFDGEERCLTISDKGVAQVNSIVIAHCDKRVFAANNHFSYVSGTYEALRPASRLPSDLQFRPRNEIR